MFGSRESGSFWEYRQIFEFVQVCFSQQSPKLLSDSQKVRLIQNISYIQNQWLPTPDSFPPHPTSMTAVMISRVYTSWMYKLLNCTLYAQFVVCQLNLSTAGFYFFHKFIYFFGCVGSLLLRVGFLQLRRAGTTLCCGARASHCGGFSCCGAQALGTRASVVVARGLSSCGAQAQLLRGMWDLPGPGLEPVFPALGRWILNHCITREVPIHFFLDSFPIQAITEY